MPDPSIEELVSSVYETRSSRNCWAQSLKGQAAELIRVLEERVAVGDMPVYSRVAVVLASLGTKITSGSVSNHLTGRCRCKR